MFDVPLSQYTTIKLGGPAKFFVVPFEENEVKNIVKLCNEFYVKFFILGNGSNLVVSDEGFKGVVLYLRELHSFKISKINDKNIEFTMGAGTLLYDAANLMYELGYGGFEDCEMIPGTIGGAVTMNASAWKGICDYLLEAKVMDKSGEIKVLRHKELKFGFRTSLVKEKGLIVLEAKFRLYKEKKDKIKEKMEYYRKSRDKRFQ